MYLSRIPAQRRSFVSTLLSRTWENYTVLELRKEAKARGLSTQGNKSTLVARIKVHEQNGAISISPPVNTPGIPKKPSQAATPGIPLDAQPDRAFTRPDFLSIKLPDLTRPLPNTPVQVPYAPDFWNSAAPSANPPLEFERPKMHVVGGSATHYDGGPTHNLEKLSEGDPLSATAQTEEPPVSKDAGFWPDFWESLGLPRTFSARRSLSGAAKLAVESGKDANRSYSRPLTDEERKGLYILLGIIGGSWLVGGLVN